MISVLVGSMFVALGAWGVARWFDDFLIVARGMGPISILLGGLVAIVIGFASLQPRRRSSSEKE